MVLLQSAAPTTARHNFEILKKKREENRKELLKIKPVKIHEFNLDIYLQKNVLLRFPPQRRCLMYVQRYLHNICQAGSKAESVCEYMNAK